MRDKNTKSWTLSNLHFLFGKRKIWLNPTYQREAVWTKSQKQLLIDSLLQGIDIPKLYFRKIDKDGFDYEVVDGQQRLRAVFDYFGDEFKLSSDSDPVQGFKTQGKLYSELRTELQMELQNCQLDVVVFGQEWTDEDIEETFLRLQNGSPLNAAEKRRAIQGSMRAIVEELANHKLFGKLTAFSDKRFAYEDAAAKVLHLMLNGSLTDIRHASIKRTYEQNRQLSSEDPIVKETKTALNFIERAFRGKQSPGFKKYAVITTTYLAAELLKKYNIAQYGEMFADSYLAFEHARIVNKERDENDEKYDSVLASYTDAARADSVQDLEYRHEKLRDWILVSIPQLESKSPIRAFSAEQRKALYFRDKGICQLCSAKCPENEFHADHIKPHSEGGATVLENGRVLCPKCNLTRPDRVEDRSGA